MAVLLIVDGHSLLYRAYHALPPLTRPDGTPTGAVYGFSTMLLKAIEDVKPHGVVVAFDTPAPTFRHLAYEQYKAQREASPDDFRVQVPLAKALLEKLGIAHVVKDGFEADDVLGSLARRASVAGHRAVILTGDRDLLQLVGHGVEVLLTTRRGLSEVERLSEEQHVTSKLGVRPEQVPDLKGLMGDASDNIPGVAGIGEKSAVQLLERYQTIEGIYESMENIQEKRWKKALAGQYDVAVQSRDLATINVTLDIDGPALGDQPFQIAKTDALNAFLKELGFDSLARRLFGAAADEPEPLQVEPSVLQAAKPLAEWPRRAEVLAVRPEGQGYMLAGENVAGYWDQGPCPLPHQKLVGFSIKPWILHWPEPSREQVVDAEIALYLLDPSRAQYSIGMLVQMVGGDKSAGDDDLHTLAAVWPAVEQLLDARGQHALFREVEMPLVSVLARMEAHGLLVDRSQLHALGEELDQSIGRLQEEIYHASGGAFNINSPQQLGEVLFDRLGLPVSKKTKTGYSTDADTLEQLAPLHPVVEKVLVYRQLAKLKGTYVDGLSPLIGQDGRVHTHFNQTVTATGRLSSSDPNLQNIPVRLPMGRRIRRVFLPTPGRLFLAADYSQIELRILAHLSQDPTLLDAFRTGEDIHRRTAAEMFGLEPEEVTEELRSRAKAINFGIIYGISDFGLANNTGVSRHEAGEYIARYFSRYPGIRGFLDGAVEEARTQGYVTTMLGRRRYLPEIHAKNHARRQYAERTAMNTVIQGSAADLIKVAMVRVQGLQLREGLQSPLVLQVHDELIWDMVPQEEECLTRLAIETMTRAMDLRVPLVVDLKRGDNWENLKRIDAPEGRGPGA